MIAKINRNECLEKYPGFPLRWYDENKDEDIFKFPNISSSYILTLESKTFKGHISTLGVTLKKLLEEMSIDSIIFLGDTIISWRHQENDYLPVQKALQYLSANHVGKRFNGALQVYLTELPNFIKHLGWLVRCNAVLPYFYFMDQGQQLLGTICQYGNLHMHILNKSIDPFFDSAVQSSKLQYLAHGRCGNQFGKTSKLPGRKSLQ